MTSVQKTVIIFVVNVYKIFEKKNIAQDNIPGHCELPYCSIDPKLT
jgi:hypothetical protein